MLAEIIIGKPLVTVNEIGFNNPIYSDERYLPNLLISLGLFKSKSQIKKNRPDLMLSLDKLDFMEIKIGKSYLWILVGE